MTPQNAENYFSLARRNLTSLMEYFKSLYGHPHHIESLENHFGKNGRSEFLLGQPVNRSFRFSEAQVKKIKHEIETLMIQQAPYLKPRYGLSNLAWQSKMQLHQLSAFINTHYGMNYNDFMNYYRVQYFKKRIGEDESWKQLTLEAIARASGFGNRNTFTAALKKFCGVTPTLYLKMMKEREQPAA